jgi:hypothetical protein
VWFDADITHGAGLDEQITTELDSAACVLNCWTPATLCSLPKSPGRARQQRDRCRPEAAIYAVVICDMKHRNAPRNRLRSWQIVQEHSRTLKQVQLRILRGAIPRLRMKQASSQFFPTGPCTAT